MPSPISSVSDMYKHLNDYGLARFLRDESGIVTTDWIILTGAIVGLGLGASVSVRGGVQALVFDIQTSLSSASVADLGTLGVGSVTPWAYTMLFRDHALSETYLANGFPDALFPMGRNNYQGITEQANEWLAFVNAEVDHSIATGERATHLWRSMLDNAYLYDLYLQQSGQPGLADFQETATRAIAHFEG